MKRNARAGLLLALLSGLLLVTLARSGRRPAEARFASTEELLRLAGQNGLHCYPGSDLPHLWRGYFVTDHPKTRVELETLCKGCCGQMPKWDGVLWVCDLGTLDGPRRFGPPEVGGNLRTLGRVLVAGDERLIRRVEDAYCRRSGGPGRR